MVNLNINQRVSLVEMIRCVHQEWTCVLASWRCACVSTEVPFFTMESTNDPGDSWGFDNGWGATTTNTTTTTHSSSSSSSSSTGATSRQELLQKRREERRLKQQAAREKRSAGMSLKPSGLGVAKKDFWIFNNLSIMCWKVLMKKNRTCMQHACIWGVKCTSKQHVWWTII